MPATELTSNRPSLSGPVTTDTSCPAPPTWAALLEAAGSGDPVAWGTLVAQNDRLLHYVVGKYRLQSHDAADVVQITWLRLVENLGRIRDPERLPGWLSTTATRAALATSRRRTRETTVEGFDMVDPDAGDVAERVATKLQLERLRQALRTLPARDRRLLEMLMLPEEPSYQEISRRLGMPIGSIGPVRQRALARLRVMLAEPATACRPRTSGSTRPGSGSRRSRHQSAPVQPGRRPSVSRPTAATREPAGRTGGSSRRSAGQKAVA
ncbi:MAG TPA: sigma-70 family RNA polymerase sigma factor [Kineosporiaceae bacterium]